MPCTIPRRNYTEDTYFEPQTSHSYSFAAHIAVPLLVFPPDLMQFPSDVPFCYVYCARPEKTDLLQITWLNQPSAYDALSSMFPRSVTVCFCTVVSSRILRQTRDGRTLPFAICKLDVFRNWAFPRVHLSLTASCLRYVRRPSDVCRSLSTPFHLPVDRRQFVPALPKMRVHGASPRPLICHGHENPFSHWYVSLPLFETPLMGRIQNRISYFR